MMAWKYYVRGILPLAVLLGGLALNVGIGEAHRPITSKYTYNDDIFPIMRDHCGRCAQRGIRRGGEDLLAAPTGAQCPLTQQGADN